ncbi:MAG: TPM domain-containing protein [Candidatus Cybelea sp.]
MKAISARSGAGAAVLAALLGAAALPAGARDFVQDQAAMFSSATVAQLNTRISNFNTQTGKEVVVVTTPSLGGATLQDAAASAFSQQNVNGVLVFIARDDRRDIIVPDRAGRQAGWFTPDVLRSIRTSMENQFRGEGYDAGITGAVDAILNVYRAHLGGLQQRASNGAALPVQRPSSGGVHISMFWWVIIAVVAFLLLRSILRALAAPRYYGGAPGAPGVPPPGTPPGPGYGSGYGPGYGGYGGGGSFWTGLLGGLGGAWLGNELFRGAGGIAPTQAGQLPADTGGGWGTPADSGGWQSDAGQADPGGASSGDWSGGGFGGDSGGGADLGGGGGDSGGGW